MRPARSTGPNAPPPSRLDNAPKWRHTGAHDNESRSQRSRARLERFTVRLPAEMVEAIDAECSRRAGNVSRNTWLTEAVQEKLARNGAASQSTSAGEGA
ncbi:ribbon-helix-helix domain-containing protein [Rhizorhabdus histidinilytica]